MISGTVMLDDQLTIEDVNYYNALEERDEAKAIIIRPFGIKKDDGSDYPPNELCPSCGESVLYDFGTFCQYCGQRLMRSKKDGNDTQHKSETDK